MSKKNIALKFAVNLDMQEQALSLIRANASLNKIIDAKSTEQEKNRALKFAISHNMPEAALGFIAQGASLNTQDVAGKTILALAIDNGDKQLVSKLCSASNINLELKDYAGRSPLTSAVDLGDQTIIKTLVINGVDLSSSGRNEANDLTINGKVFLKKEQLAVYWQEALDNGNFKALKSLAIIKPELNDTLIDGKSSLQYALAQGKQELFIAMLASGLGSSDEIEKREGKVTAIAMLASNEDSEIVRNLISKGVDLNILRDEKGEFPQACQKHFSDKKLAEYLEHSILEDNFTAVNNLLHLNDAVRSFAINGVKPVDYAIEHKKNNLAIKMAEAGFVAVKYKTRMNKPLDNALNLAIHLQDEAALADILKKSGVDVNMQITTDGKLYHQTQQTVHFHC